MPEELFTQIRNILANYEQDIASKLDELATLNTSIEGRKVELEVVKATLDQTRKDAKSEVEKIEVNTDLYKKENTRVKDENSAIVAQTAELKTQNIRLDKQNKDFKQYESQAWKALKAKDESLVERERLLQQKENLKPTPQSFLPPTN